MTGPSNIARMKAGLALALIGSMIGYLEPAYCEGQRFIDRGTISLATAPTWFPAGNLNTARHGHTATLLPNGKVLVAGGANSGGILDSAELYDPATGTWSVTGRLNAAHAGHTATLLQNGKVLVAGGGVAPSLPSTAEVYDPATGTWSATGSLAAAHTGHAATSLPDGKVLIVGGTVDFSMPNNAELYDPAAGTWGPAGSPTWSRVGHTATLLQNGSVLVAGGIIGPYDADIEFPAASNAELYEPISGSWRTVGTAIRLSDHIATLLPNGKVLVAGGFGAISCGPGCLTSTLGRSAELYDPMAGVWSRTGNLTMGHFGHTASLLPNGKVLVAGSSDIGAGNSAELYDPDTAQWTNTSNLDAGRSSHTATLLLNGNVLVAGGFRPGSSPLELNSAELYDDGALRPGTIGPGFTGAWYDPAQSGHGIFVQILSDQRFYAAWFAFNPAGTQQAWFTGVGTYSGNTASITAVEMPTNERWIPNFDPGQIVRNPWGTLMFTFTDCNHGRVDFNSVAGYGTGRMNLTRLTQPAGLSCP